MRILVLSSNNGEGHNSASRAVIEQAEKRGVFGIMIDTLLFDSAKHSDWVRKIHVNSALRAPGIFKAGNEIAEKMTEWGVEKGKPSACYLANARYAERIQKFIDDNGFDVVVATHIFAPERRSSAAILLSPITAARRFSPRPISTAILFRIH